MEMWQNICYSTNNRIVGKLTEVKIHKTDTFVKLGWDRKNKHNKEEKNGKYDCIKKYMHHE